MDDFLTVADVATILKKDRDWVREHAAMGDLPGKKIGKVWRFRSSDIEAWWAAQ